MSSASAVIKSSQGGSPPKIIRRFQSPAVSVGHSGASATAVTGNKTVVVQVKIDCSQQALSATNTVQSSTASTVPKQQPTASSGITVLRRDNCCVISIPRSAVKPVGSVSTGASVIRVATKRLHDSVGGQVKALVAAQENYSPPTQKSRQQQQQQLLSTSDALQSALILLPAGTTRKRYQCRLCGNCYARVEYLSRHVRLAHLRDSRLLTNEDAGGAGDDEEEEEDNDESVIVQVPTGGGADDEEEVVSRSLEDKPADKKSTRKRKQPQQKQPQQKQQLLTGPRCTLCDRRFANADELKRHLMSHPGSYECTRCGRWFPSLPGLRRHTNEAHPKGQQADSYDLEEDDEDDKEDNNSEAEKQPRSGGGGGRGRKSQISVVSGGQSFAKPCVCALCQANFADSLQLANHVKSIHRLRKTGARGEERCYQCAYCAKCFHQHTNLRRHLTCHTGQRQFPCPICERRFADRGDVNKHMVTHTGVRPFKCQVCGRRFGQRTNLRTHALTHSAKPTAAAGQAPAAAAAPAATPKAAPANPVVKRSIRTRRRAAANDSDSAVILETVDAPEADGEIVLG